VAGDLVLTLHSVKLVVETQLQKQGGTHQFLRDAFGAFGRTFTLEMLRRKRDRESRCSA